MSADAPGVDEPTTGEKYRTTAFLIIQACFLLVSPLCGGFHNKIWSTLESSLLIIGLGLTGLALILITSKARRRAFRAAVIFYIAGVIDMSVNVLVTGWIGWKQ